MTAYGPPAVPRSAASPDQRAAMFCYIAGGLGVLSFVWGFLKWLTESDFKASGYAASLGASGAVAPIGFSLAAGLLAAALAWEKKPASLTPVVLAVTSLLLIFGIMIGKNGVKITGEKGTFGIGIGLILALITVLLQVGVLVFAWMTANGKIAAKPAAPAWPAQQPQQPYPGQPGQSGQYGPPQTYGPGPGQAPPSGPPQAYGPGQAPPSGPTQGYGPPPSGPPQGYGPPPGQ